ncbi:MAG: hypothetical protein JXA36_05250 [Coriobacteriia bacterium]|nr:hypothetical protein [Coriobacteriia bacterium]
MDCLSACEIISTAHDRELVDADLLIEARAHVAECAECRAFVRALARSAEIPGPQAPDELLDRLLAASAQAAAATREAVAAPDSVPGTAQLPTRPGVSQWVPRFTAFASAAAVLLIALTAGSVALLNSLGSQQAEDSLSAPTTAEREDATSETAAGVLESQITAPAYITLNGGVWVLVDSAGVVPSKPETAGVVTSSLDEAGVPVEREAFFEGSATDTLHVRLADDRYFTFERVVRSYGLREYGLVSGIDIESFGTWPTLPTRFATPGDQDGTPTFRLLSFDDRGTDIFITPGGSVEDGFAVAPGTGEDDPAAGNPGWTWWEPLE